MERINKPLRNRAVHRLREQNRGGVGGGQSAQGVSNPPGGPFPSPAAAARSPIGAGTGPLVLELWT